MLGPTTYPRHHSVAFYIPAKSLTFRGFIRKPHELANSPSPNIPWQTAPTSGEWTARDIPLKETRGPTRTIKLGRAPLPPGTERVPSPQRTPAPSHPASWPGHSAGRSGKKNRARAGKEKRSFFLDRQWRSLTRTHEGFVECTGSFQDLHQILALAESQSALWVFLSKVSLAGTSTCKLVMLGMYIYIYK